MRTGLSKRFLTPLSTIIPLFVALFLAFFTPASLAQQKSRSSPGKLRILAYGDSLTAGYRLPQNEAYPAQLQDLLRQENAQAEVINSGISGDTSKQALERLGWNLSSQGPFDLAIVGIGANDGLRRLPVAALQTNLEALVQKLQKAGVQVLLLGMKLPLNFSPAYRRDFEGVYKKVSQKTGAVLLPFMLEGVALKESLNLDDGIHPNREGHAHIAARILQVLKDKKFY